MNMPMDMHPLTDDNVASSSSVTSHFIPHDLHQRAIWNRRGVAGSLPIKKRRLLVDQFVLQDESDQESSDSTTSSAWDTALTMQSMALSPGTCEEKIAALVLVAAASAASEPFLETSSSPSQAISSHNNLDPASNFQNECGVPYTSFHMQLQPQPHSQQLSEASSKVARNRVHHPPLSSPLPNGCHGRTSRNNSYCRRQPCYNGSSYCKLHYQQYIVTGKRIAPDNSIEPSVEDKPPATNETSTGEQSTPSSPNNSQQDKRYTGIDDEIRCEATTTRGRPCAYVSVNESKYCYLHVDYDTNPSPRRTCCSSCAPGESQHFQQQQDDDMLKETESTRPLNCLSKDGPGAAFGSPPCTSSLAIPEVSPLYTSLKGSTSPLSILSYPSEAHGDSNTTDDSTHVGMNHNTDSPKLKSTSSSILLSSISSNQWLNKLVTIATGPLIHHAGRVTKWGNGWVTVKILNRDKGEEGVDGFLHNRRSVELYLLPAQEEQTDNVNRQHQIDEDASQLSTPTASNAEEDVSDEDQSEIRRCVSRDKDDPVVKDESIVESQKLEQEGGSGTETKARTAVKMKNERDSVAETKVKDSTQQEKVTSPEAPLSNPIECKPREKSLQTRSHVAGVPLVEELKAAQEGRGGRKHNLNLLFGTAALERSRRTVHKPTRYEDTAMLETTQSMSSDIDAVTISSRRR